MISQAQLCRENGHSNIEIADILHVSAATIAAWIGRQPSTIYRRCRRRGRQRRLTDEERRANKLTTARRASAAKAKELREGPSAGWVHSADYATVDEPPERANELSPRAASDIAYSINAYHASSGSPLRASFTASGALRVDYTDSDAFPWHDEAEPEWPHVPTAHRYYQMLASYAANQRASASRDPRVFSGFPPSAYPWFGWTDVD